jgi:hypothetical protein
LAWGTSPTATGYQVFGGTSSGGENSSIGCTATAPQTTCTVQDLAGGSSYFFVVEAQNVAGFSSHSNQVIINPPPPPTGLTVTATTVDSVTLTWVASSQALQYNIYVSTVPGQELTNGPACTTQGTLCQVNALTSGTTYYFVVEAQNVAGSSDPSNEVSATPGDSGTELRATLSGLPASGLPAPGLPTSGLSSRGPPSRPVLLAGSRAPVARARGPGV